MQDPDTGSHTALLHHVNPRTHGHAYLGLRPQPPPRIVSLTSTVCAQRWKGDRRPCPGDSTGVRRHSVKAGEHTAASARLRSFAVAALEGKIVRRSPSGDHFTAISQSCSGTLVLTCRSVAPHWQCHMSAITSRRSTRAGLPRSRQSEASLRVGTYTLRARLCRAGRAFRAVPRSIGEPLEMPARALSRLYRPRRTCGEASPSTILRVTWEVWSRRDRQRWLGIARRS